MDKKNSFDKRTKQEEEIYSQIKQKNQTIALQKQETIQKEKPKVLTKTKESISSSSTVGFVSILTLTLIIGIIVIIAGLCLNI